MLTVAHSPDADDRFMFWPVREGLVPARHAYCFVELDTQGLNDFCLREKPAVCAISAAHYANVWREYQPMRMGTSVGDGYGPVLVKPVGNGAQNGRGILLTPGLQTTAHTVLARLGYRFESVEVVPISPMQRVFDRMNELHAQKKDVAALLIHEGRLLYKDYGCELITDTGVEWSAQKKLPLPLGINVISRALSETDRQELSQLFRESCAYAMMNIDEFVTLSSRKDSPYHSPLTEEQMRAYLKLYANARTLDVDAATRTGFEELLKGENEISFDWI